MRAPQAPSSVRFRGQVASMAWFEERMVERRASVAGRGSRCVVQKKLEAIVEGAAAASPAEAWPRSLVATAMRHYRRRGWGVGSGDEWVTSPRRRVGMAGMAGRNGRFNSTAVAVSKIVSYW